MKLADWLGVSYKTAWHVGHRIRAMMASQPVLLQGGAELDETYVGEKSRKVDREKRVPKGDPPKRKPGRATDKACVFVAVARGGRVTSRGVPSHTKGALGGAVRASVHRDAVLVADELPAYIGVGREYAAHHRVREAGECGVCNRAIVPSRSMTMVCASHAATESRNGEVGNLPRRFARST